MSADTMHTDVAAYALGLLEQPDRRAFEVHLSTCMMCHAELTEFRGLAQALDGMGPVADPLDAVPTPPEPSVVTDMLRYRSRKERRQRVTRTFVGAAAGLVLLGGALVAGVTVGAADNGEQGGGATTAGGTSTNTPATAQSDPTGVQSLFSSGHRLTGADSGTGITGTVAMEPKVWGSRIGLQLSRVGGPRECELVAVDKRGDSHTVVGWSVPTRGYGLKGSPMPSLTLQGGTALKPAEISRFEVRTIGTHRTLLSVPV